MEDYDRNNQYGGKQDNRYGTGYGMGRRMNTSSEKHGIAHKISISGRNEGTITGVEEVNEFDNDEISLDTSMGRLIIKGHELHVKRLNLEKGEVDIEGSIDSIYYTSKKDNESMLKRLFK